MTDNIEAPWVGNPPEEIEREIIYECVACGEKIKRGNTYYKIPVEGYDGKLEYERLCTECFKSHARLEFKKTAY